MKDDPNFYRLTVQTSDTTGLQDPTFSIGEEEVIKIKVWRFEGYPISIKNKYNVEVTKQDTINGIFQFIPLDTTFAIEVWQNYGQNHVFFKSKLDTGYSIQSWNGPNVVADREWSIE